MNDYWTSVKDKTPKGWCNVMLCHFDKVIAPSGRVIKKYGEIQFGLGIFHKSENIETWNVVNYEMDEWDVIAFHEVEEDSLEIFVRRMNEE